MKTVDSTEPGADASASTLQQQKKSTETTQLNSREQLLEVQRPNPSIEIMEAELWALQPVYSHNFSLLCFWLEFLVLAGEPSRLCWQCGLLSL